MTIKIIEKEYPKNKFQCQFCIYLMGAMFGSVFPLALVGKIWPSELLDTIIITLGLISIAMYAFFFLVSIGKKVKIIHVGSVLLRVDGLEIVHKEETIFVPYPEVRNINLRYSGYKGVYMIDVRPSFFPEDGLGNILSFTHEGKSYRYEIFLENKRQKDALFKTMKRLGGRIGRF